MLTMPAGKHFPNAYCREQPNRKASLFDCQLPLRQLTDVKAAFKRLVQVLFWFGYLRYGSLITWPESTRLNAAAS